MSERPILWIACSSAALVAAAWVIWGWAGKSSVMLNGMMIYSGVVISAAIGFIGLIINSNHQERLRFKAMDEQRDHERRTLAAALLGETEFFEAFWTGTRDSFARMDEDGFARFRAAMHTDVFPLRIHEANFAKLGLLGVDSVGSVVDFYLLHQDLALRLGNPKNLADTLDQLQGFLDQVVAVRAQAAEQLRAIVNA